MMLKKFVVRFSMTARLAFNDFKSRYAGSFLGAIWAISEPIVTVLVYWFVYSVTFGKGTVDGVPYYLWLSAGIAPWFFVSNGLCGITNAFRDYSYLVKKMRFDKKILPSVKAMSALTAHVVFLLIVCVMSGIGGYFSVFSLLLLVIDMLIAYAFVYTAGKILALICARLKDTANVLSVILNVGFWLTPIFWDSNGLSGFAAKAVMCNPAAIIVRMYRLAILYKSAPLLSDVCIICGFTVVLLIIGSISEKRVLPNIADKL